MSVSTAFKWSAFYQINVNYGGKKRQHSDKHAEVHCSVWHFENSKVKTPNRNTCHSGIQGCVVCPVCPSGVAVPCCLIGKYAQPIIFGDTMVIGMPPGLPPYWQKPPTKKNYLHASRGKVFRVRRGEFCERAVCVRKQGKVLRAYSVHTRAVLHLAGHNIAPGVRNAG